MGKVILGIDYDTIRPLPFDKDVKASVGFMSGVIERCNNMHAELCEVITGTVIKQSYCCYPVSQADSDFMKKERRKEYLDNRPQYYYNFVEHQHNGTNPEYGYKKEDLLRIASIPVEETTNFTKEELILYMDCVKWKALCLEYTTILKTIIDYLKEDYKTFTKEELDKLDEIRERNKYDIPCMNCESFASCTDKSKYLLEE